MIAFIKGTVAGLYDTGIIVENQGMGYEVETTQQMIGQVQQGASIMLHIHQVIREDAHLLFGFENTQEKALFRMLIKINGVGPRLALAILSALSVAHFIQAVRAKDVAALTQVSGIGKKTAERILVDVQDRIDSSLEFMSLSAPASDAGDLLSGTVQAEVLQGQKDRQDAEQALIALGYSQINVRKALSEIEEANDVSEWVRLGLKQLSTVGAA